MSFAKLDRFVQQRVLDRLEQRRVIYEMFLKGKFRPSYPVFMIVGDRPGPSAPTDPGYHHTPFYSTKHCSGWLNILLDSEQIPEDRLVWVNSADRLGNPTDFRLVEILEPDVIIALGGNAEKWLTKNNFGGYLKVVHPQYHKRFHNKQPYALISTLKILVKNND